METEMPSIQTYKTTSLKKIPQLTDRELQERMCELLEKQEKHQYYFSTVLTIYIVISVIGIIVYTGVLADVAKWLQS